MTGLPTAPPVPCGTCPYRRDVPSGIWDRTEYEKLPEYDQKTPDQPIAAFFCHQRDGCLCGGWLLAHDPRHLLALRMQPVDPAVYTYAWAGPVFGSGQEAHDHGVRDIDNPSREAKKKIAGLLRLRGICGYRDDEEETP